MKIRKMQIKKAMKFLKFKSTKFYSRETKWVYSNRNLCTSLLNNNTLPTDARNIFNFY